MNDLTIPKAVCPNCGNAVLHEVVDYEGCEWRCLNWRECGWIWNEEGKKSYRSKWWPSGKNESEGWWNKIISNQEIEELHQETENL